MARRGRKPKTTRQKELAGNPGQRPLNDSEPEPVLGAPPMPSHMELDAAECWETVCRHLDGMGILAESDVAILTVYCDSWSDYLVARAIVEDEGPVLTGEKGGKYMHPAFSAQLALRKQLATYAAELGLTPSARSRVHATPKSETNEKTKGFQVVG